MIRKIKVEDAERICENSNHDVLYTAISAETDAVGWADILADNYPYSVYKIDGKVNNTRRYFNA